MSWLVLLLGAIAAALGMAFFQLNRVRTLRDTSRRPSKWDALVDGGAITEVDLQRLEGEARAATANALQAIGAKIAVGRERPVVLHLGDGALTYSAAGFWTMARYNTAILTVISNNETYQVVRTNWAREVPDSVGIGHYSMDLHRTTFGDRPKYGDTLPFQIPLGSLLPRRMENLLPACKNLGVTHMTNGCFRLHPVEWNIGESVGELVAFALASKVPPRAVRARPALLHDFQQRLDAAGKRICNDVMHLVLGMCLITLGLMIVDGELGWQSAVRGLFSGSDASDVGCRWQYD